MLARRFGTGDAQGMDSDHVSPSHAQRVLRGAELVEQLHGIVAQLEALHPGRRFPLDGHLVGSIGETLAESMFAIRLQPASTAGHDAIASDGRAVEIKATYGNSRVGLRATSHEAAAALIVIRLSGHREQPHEVVYNGSLIRAAHLVGKPQSNGQAWISLSRLRQLDGSVPPDKRVPPR